MGQFVSRVEAVCFTRDTLLSEKFHYKCQDEMWGSMTMEYQRLLIIVLRLPQAWPGSAGNQL